MEKTVIDASGCVLGRLASVVAKRLLLGENIDVVNADQVVISGDSTLGIYLKKIHRGHRDRGPHFPRGSAAIFKRTVRGMLPKKKERGRSALRRLRVYSGPVEGKTEMVERTKAGSRIHSWMKLGELSKKLGGR